ncbi:MAG: hemolysin family protein [Bacteroidales bacterium]|nr:hemolysin family protein [Bacteroidales bacterium]
MQFLVLMLLLMAFFSGMEIAFVAANKLRVELDRKQGGMAGGLVGWLAGQMEMVIATSLVGMNICLVIFGFITADLFNPILAKFIHGEVWRLLLQTLIATALVLFFAEYMPKTIFRIRSNQMLRYFSLPYTIIYILLYPITWFTVHLADFLLRKVMKVPGSKQLRQMVFSKVDLTNLIHENLNDNNGDEGTDEEIRLFNNALEFSSVRIRDCMIPRTEIVALPVQASIEEFRQKFIETGFSRIVVYEDNIDRITGYVHHSSLFRNPSELGEIIRKIHAIPESMSASNLLSRMLRDHENIAAVIDEFGGTSGLVTTEDILEEIIGEIEDEHDSQELTEKKISDREYLFAGRLEIDYLNNVYNLDLPVSDDYETLAGLILHYNPSLPKVNETITIPGFSFRITGSSRKKIKQVSLTLTDS